MILLIVCIVVWCLCGIYLMYRTSEIEPIQSEVILKILMISLIVGPFFIIIYLWLYVWEYQHKNEINKETPSYIWKGILQLIGENKKEKK